VANGPLEKWGSQTMAWGRGRHGDRSPEMAAEAGIALPAGGVNREIAAPSSRDRHKLE